MIRTVSNKQKPTPLQLGTSLIHWSLTIVSRICVISTNCLQSFHSFRNWINKLYVWKLNNIAQPFTEIKNVSKVNSCIYTNPLWLILSSIWHPSYISQTFFIPLSQWSSLEWRHFIGIGWHPSKKRADHKHNLLSRKATVPSLSLIFFPVNCFF